jgi:hypothetical protein
MEQLTDSILVYLIGEVFQIISKRILKELWRDPVYGKQLNKREPGVSHPDLQFLPLLSN